MPFLLRTNALCDSLLLWTVLPCVSQRVLQMLVDVAGAEAPGRAGGLRATTDNSRVGVCAGMCACVPILSPAHTLNFIFYALYLFIAFKFALLVSNQASGAMQQKASHNLHVRVRWETFS